MSPDLHTLTGAYALDALPDDERREFERHLATCGACQQEVAELRTTAGRMAAAGYEEPPAGLKGRVMAEIDTVRQERPRTVDPREERPGNVVPLSRRRAAQGILAAAAVVLAIAAVALGVTVSELRGQVDTLEAQASQVADVLAAADAELISLETDVGGVAQFVYSSSQGEAVFLAKGLPRLPEDEVYELWLIGADGPVPAGLFRPGERGTATQLLAGGIGSAQAVAVTVEPAGGSPEPTTDPIVVLEIPRGT